MSRIPYAIGTLGSISRDRPVREEIDLDRYFEQGRKDRLRKRPFTWCSYKDPEKQEAWQRGWWDGNAKFKGGTR